MKNFEAYIALGGNVGDVAKTMQQAIYELSKISNIEKCSSLYQTPPWGNVNQPNFLNACIKINTQLLPIELLLACKAIEKKLGRKSTEKWAPRVIDLDILCHFATKSYESEYLTLPHPYMCVRAFVLLPLQEIAPELQINNKSLDYYINKLKKEDLDKILLDNTNKKWKTIV